MAARADMLALAALLATAAGGMPAAAQVAPLAPAPNPPSMTLAPKGAYTPAQAQAALEKFTDCMVGNPRTRGKVKAFIRAIPGSPAYFAAGRPLAVGECVPVQRGPGSFGLQLTIKQDTMRAASFVSLFRREFGKRAPIDLSALPELRLSEELDGPIDQIPADFRGQRALGDCVVRAVPATVRDLLFAVPGSPEETAQFTQIVPAMQGCLTVDQTIAFDKYELRGILGEAIYRLELAYARAYPAQKAGTKG